MRAQMSLFGVGVLLLALTACTQARAQSSSGAAPTAASPAPATSPEVPAADAGGACELLDYESIRLALDVSFDVAAAADSGRTDSCVVRSSDDELPDLTLTLSPTKAGSEVFLDELPDDARPVKELGKAAYRTTSEPTRESGPVAEVGWLADDKKIITLRFTMRPGSPRLAADWMTNGLVELAERIDKSHR